jgi:hypothetical protein
MSENVQTERETTRLLVGWLRSEGYDPHRRNVGGVRRRYKGKTRYISFNEKGECDWWLILGDGRHCDIEIKRPGARPSFYQIIWMLRLLARGAPAFYCDSLPILTQTMKFLEVGGHIYMRSDGTHDFCVDGNLSRAQALSMLAIMAGDRRLSRQRAREILRYVGGKVR